MDMIPRISHEADMARWERVVHRLVVVIIVLILLLFGSNAAWLAYEQQFTEEVTTTTVEASADTGNAIANASGEVNYNGGEG